MLSQIAMRRNSLLFFGMSVFALGCAEPDIGPDQLAGSEEGAAEFIDAEGVANQEAAPFGDADSSDPPAAAEEVEDLCGIESEGASGVAMWTALAGVDSATLVGDPVLKVFHTLADGADVRVTMRTASDIWAVDLPLAAFAAPVDLPADKQLLADLPPPGQLLPLYARVDTLGKGERDSVLARPAFLERLSDGETRLYSQEGARRRMAELYGVDEAEDADAEDRSSVLAGVSPAIEIEEPTR